MTGIDISGILMGVAGSAILLLLGIIGKFIWNKIAKLDKVAQDQAEIRYNYMNRFDEVKTLITQENTQTRQQISDLHLDLARNYLRRNECAYIRTGAEPDAK